MITQVYEEELAEAFEALLQSVDLATQKLQEKQMSEMLKREERLWNGISDEIQSKILFFQSAVINDMKQAFLLN
jgi:hypothetical protein